METIDIIINTINALHLPVWIPVLVAGLLRWAELKWNIFGSNKLQKKDHG
jgi:hypothetical protein